MRISLRYKFIIAFIVFTAVLTATFGMVATQRLSSQLKTQYERHAAQLAQQTAEDVLESRIFAVGHDLTLVARNLLSEEVIYAQIVLDGQVLAQEMRYDVDLPVIAVPDRLEMNELTLAGQPPYLDLIQPLDNAVDLLLQSGHTITPEDQERLQKGIHGYVRLGFSLKQRDQEVQREALLLTALSLGLMVLGILLAWSLYRTILGPIEQLSATVRDFGQGKTYARVTVNSGDEIEALANEFNTMANAIEYQRDALRRTNEELERANQVKSNFLATMSHELRTPLHSILGYTSLLLAEVHVKLNDSGRQYATAIQRAGKHLLTLIGNLLQFSKLEAGVERLHLVEVRIAEVVHEVLENQRPLADEKRLRLDAEVEPGLTLHTDATKLKQVLLNLVNNGIKYATQGGVHVLAESRSKYAYFAVSDTGPGIAPEIQATLFDPFTRGFGSDQPGDGVGLGLAVAKRYVELMGGSLSVKSEIGRGSTFRFSLPSPKSTA
jgi:signal transduction histidine kinase